MHKLLSQISPKIKEVLLITFGLGLGLCFFTFNVIGFDFKYFPGDLGDARLNIYFLEHVFQYFTGKITAFWDVAFMYPEKNVLAYSDNLLGSAPIYALFRLLGFDVYRSFQLWYIAVTLLNFLSAYYFLKYVFKNNYAAILGAFVFAFSLALQSQIGHAQTFPRFPIPLAFLMAYKFKENLNPKFFFLAILLVVYQIYCGIYLGFMLAIPIGVYLLFVLLDRRVYQKPFSSVLKWAFKLILGFAINLILVVPLMLPYLERKHNPSLEHFEEIAITIPKISSYLFSINGSILWDVLSDANLSDPVSWEHQLFTGGLVSIGLVFGFAWILAFLFKIKNKSTNEKNLFFLLLTSILTLILFLKIDSFTAYKAIYYLPGFNSMRCITRIINVELIFFSIGTALLFTKVFNWLPKHRLLIFVSSFTLLIIDNYTYENLALKSAVKEANSRTETLESTFAKIPKGAIISYEPDTMKTAALNYQLDAMILSQKYGQKTLNGYTATSSSAYAGFWFNLDEKTRVHWLSSNNFLDSSIFVITSPNSIKHILVSEMKNVGPKTEKELQIKYKMNYILTDSTWLHQIEQKAIKNNLSLDSMLYLDAKWVLDNDTSISKESYK